jgi:hypothetical protein
MTDAFFANYDLEEAYKVLTIELINITKALPNADAEYEKYYTGRSKQIAKDLLKNSQAREKLRPKLIKEKHAAERRMHAEEMRNFQLERKERLEIEAAKHKKITWTIEKF